MPMKSRFSASHIPALLTLAAVPHAAQAGTVMLWPIDPVIEPGRDATILWLENRGDTATVMQVRVLGWNQDSGTDQQSQQDKVIASPPIARIPAGGKQVVRLISTGGQRPAGEDAYRVIVDELPVVQPDHMSADTGNAIRFQMRYSVPLFVYGGEARNARQSTSISLRCAVTDANGRKQLQLINTGTMHARLTDVRFGGEGERSVPLGSGLLGYVLPGSKVRWPLPDGVSGRESVSMTVNGSASRVTIPGCAPG